MELQSIDQPLSAYAVYASYFDNDSKDEMLGDEDDDEDDIRLSSTVAKPPANDSSARQKSPPAPSSSSRPPSTRQRVVRAASSDGEDAQSPDPEVENLDYTWLVGQDGHEALANPARRPAFGELWRFDLKARCSIEADPGQSTIRELTVDPTETRFMTCAKNGTVKIWDLCSHPVRQLAVYKEHSGSVFGAKFLQGRNKAATCDGSIHVWDVERGVTLMKYTNSPEFGSFTSMVTVPVGFGKRHMSA